jgi:L-rhamnose mutarotase
MKKYVLALDLKDDEELIQAYEAYHRAVWPEVLKSIKEAGITQMEIFKTGNRLCMVIETVDAFSFERKSQLDGANQKVQEWEALMGRFQQALPHARQGEKWMEMNRIFKLS